MDIDETKIIAAILTTAMRRDSVPSVDQIILTYERVLGALRERETERAAKANDAQG